MGVLILFDTDRSSNCRSRLKSAISNNGENISDIMSQAISLEVSSFLVELNFEGSTRLLDNTIIDSFVSVKDSLEISVLNGEQRSGGLIGLITSTNIQQDTCIISKGKKSIN